MDTSSVPNLPQVVPMIDTTTFRAIACCAMLSITAAIAAACFLALVSSAASSLSLSSSLIGPRSENGSSRAKVNTRGSLLAPLVPLRVLLGDGALSLDDIDPVGDGAP